MNDDQPDYMSKNSHLEDEETENYQRKIRELSAIPLIKSVTPEYITTFQHFNLRYFKDYYCIKHNRSSNNDVLVRLHTNQTALITIAKGHDIFRNDLKIESIDFNVNGKDRSDIHISGKKKRGATLVGFSAILCYLECNDGKKYPVFGSVKGRLLELNKHVLKNPNILKSDYKGLGYIGIILPLKADEASIRTHLISEADYEKHLRNNNYKS